MKSLQYSTVSEAVSHLQSKGFLINFNSVEKSKHVYDYADFQVSDLEIVEVFRYEGNTDPSDEAVVYAIKSKDGHKGIYVAGYGVSSDIFTNEILPQIKIKK